MTAKEKNDGVILNTTATDLLARAPIHVPRLASTGARAPSADATDARPTDGRAAPVFRLGASHAHRGQSSSRARDRVRCLLCCRDADAVHCGCGDRLSAERHLRAEATDRRHSGQYEARAKHVLFAAAPSFVGRRHAHRLQLRPTPPSCSLIRSSASTLVCDFGGAAVCSFTSRVVSRASVCTVLCRRGQRRDDRVADRIDRHRRQDHVLVSQSSGARTTTVLCLLCARETP